MGRGHNHALHYGKCWPRVLFSKKIYSDNFFLIVYYAQYKF